MKFLLVFIVFFVSLVANDNLVEIYRLKGIKEVQKKLDDRLQNQDYWMNYLKDKDISKGYYESINHILICQKDLKNLKLYTKEENGFKQSFSKDVFIGKEKGDKQKEGDLKTPVGTYELINKLTKNLDPFYGPMAFVISYPNAYDKLLKKDGHGIWIHGLPFEGDRDDFTQGCIALENDSIRELSQKFDFKNAILMIEEENTTKITLEEISLVLAQLYQWKQAWKDSDIDTYLSFYSKDFRKYNGTRYESLKDFKTRLFSRAEQKTIKFEDINVIPYPNLKNKKIFKVVMKQDYQTKHYKSYGKKELYLELLDGKIKILSES